MHGAAEEVSNTNHNWPSYIIRVTDRQADYAEYKTHMHYTNNNEVPQRPDVKGTACLENIFTVAHSHNTQRIFV